MKKRSRLKQKLYRMTYDRPGINKRALRIKKSLDEIKHVLEHGNKAWK